MILTNKLLPIALIAALVGGSIGALVMYRTQPATAETTAQTNAAQLAQPTSGEAISADFTPAEQTAYKTGFADGYDAAATGQAAPASTGRAATPAKRVVSRNSSNSSARRVYYDYNQPQKRSFWDKHRDKLTVAMGAGAGAAIGGLVGGKKGAAIGALSGGGGSALYTYKLRKRNRSN